MLLLVLFLFSFDSILAKPTNVGIINGTNADIADFPWMASVYDEYGFICGGSIISPNWALTTGGCAENENIIEIRVGSGNLEDFKGVYVNVAEVIVHPNFTRRTDGNPFNDLTLLRLRSPVHGTNVAPIGLPESDTSIPEGQLITISGWGDTTGSNTYPLDLKYATIEIPTIQSCIDAYSEHDLLVDPAGQFCAGTIGDTKGTCMGDSGSAAQINGTIFGVVSWGFQGCSTSRMPGVLVNVVKYMKWIHDVTGI